MKRILLAALICCLCLTVLPTALADGCGNYTETYTVFCPQYTETTTTTYGFYQSTTVTYGPACPPSMPCPPPCEPVCPPSPTKCEIQLACSNIRDHARDVLALLDRELEGSGWVRVKNAKCILNKTARCIYEVTFRNEETGEKVSCYLIVRTPYNTVRSTHCRACGEPMSCCACRPRRTCYPYFTMFTWNYNTGCRAKEYEDDWLITDMDEYADYAVSLFVEKLVKGEVVRW